MRRRDLLVAGAALLAPAAAKARVVGFPTADPFWNPINWTLDPETHPIVEAPPRAETLVVLHHGQSNDAQYSNYRYPVVHGANQFQFLFGDGTIRAFVEPVFGPGAAGSPAIGSWFGRFGDLIIDSGCRANVMHIFTALGGTSASDWGIAGKYHSILTATYFRLMAAGIQPDLIEVSQGENETFYHTPGSVWRSNWNSVIDVARNIGITSPFFFARQTYNNGAISEDVLSAQLAITGDRANVFAGPDCDAYGSAYRFDNVHWNAAGDEAVASAWANIVRTHA